MKLGQILIRRGLISSFQLDQTIELQSLGSRKIGEIMVVQGLIETPDLEEALLEQHWRNNGFWVID